MGIELTRKGWPVIPADGHRPCVPWARYKRRAPAAIEVADWAKRFPNANVALMLGDVVALDCDPANEDEAGILGEAANECFGHTDLVRVGRWPRHARFYRRGRGVQSRRGENVELKARGQLITVYGRHPDTGQPYLYPGGLELRDLSPSDLPVMSSAAAQLFWEAILPGGATHRTKQGRGATGLTFDEAMHGVAQGRRHAAMMTIAYVCRGWDYGEGRAREFVTRAATLCSPQLPVKEAYEAVQWVYAHLPAGRRRRDGQRDPGSVPRVLQIAFRHALGGRRFLSRNRYEVLLAMCRDLQHLRGDRPIGLPQLSLALVLKCSQPAVSKLIRRALEEGFLTIARGRYRPGRQAKTYHFTG